MKRKPTNEQLKRIARLYIIGKADLTKRERIGKLLFFFLDNYLTSFKEIRVKAKFYQWLDNGGFAGE